jgi:hypothetical protein
MDRRFILLVLVAVVAMGLMIFMLLQIRTREDPYVITLDIPDYTTDIVRYIRQTETAKAWTVTPSVSPSPPKTSP